MPEGIPTAAGGHTATPNPHPDHPAMAAIVTVQARPEWPVREYSFRDPAQARMFLASCQRDGDYRCTLRSAAEAARSGGVE